MFVFLSSLCDQIRASCCLEGLRGGCHSLGASSSFLGPQLAYLGGHFYRVHTREHCVGSPSPAKPQGHKHPYSQVIKLPREYRANAPPRHNSSLTTSPGTWELTSKPLPPAPDQQFCGSFGHFTRTDSLEKTLMLGKIEGRKRGGRQRTRWLNGITDSMDMSQQTPGDGEGQGSLVCCSPWVCKESDTTSD